ncbi:MAG: recombination regulator RecX [Spirochaetia bacterium]|jgi:regulatory protein|nr:recombination regulator RecX [Spirochaetia bacterium]
MRKKIFLSCYDRALGLLAAAEHCGRSLERKLLARGYAESEVAQALSRLTEEKLLDDRRFAALWIEFRQKRKDEGARRLAEGLRQRGVDRQTAEAAVREASRGEEYRAAFFRAKAKILAQARGGENRLVSLLLRKGYSLSEIRKYGETGE